MKRVIVIGGGIAGLISAIRLAKAGIDTELFERKQYPFHRVCGEYISLEALPFLKSEGLFPEQFQPARLSRFQLTSVNGKSALLPLDLGGFGISRFTFDNFLYGQALEAGVKVHVNTEVEDIELDGLFQVRAAGKNFLADVVIGAFGKRSKLDVTLRRDFIQKRSPYVGVKYHIRSDHPHDLIGLHNFKDGYCGISNIEEGKTNLCYLTHRNNLKMYRDIREMENEVLFRNPFLKSIFNNSDFLFDKPEVINEISFETKNPLENHILMAGDAAGMITPLCGNGMAMAIHSAKVLSTRVVQFCNGTTRSRQQLEAEYDRAWKALFSRRLWAGRQIQKLFGSERASDFAVGLASTTRSLARFLIAQTHGQPF